MICDFCCAVAVAAAVGHQATEFVHFEDLWSCLTDLYTDFSQTAMGIRASGAAAVNLCHLAAGGVE
jgi:fructose-1,6-bisphosphatase/inositol monophosphatase family enzyme